MKNRELYNSLKEFIVEALSLISSRIKGMDLPMSFKEKLTIQDEGYSSTQIQLINWSSILYDLEKEFKELQTYKSAVKLLESDPVIGTQINTLIGTADLRMRVDSDSFIRHLLFSLLNYKEQPVFIVDEFKKLYLEIEDFFNSQKLKNRYLAPLDNFDMLDCEQLELTEMTSIVKLTNEDATEILSGGSQFDHFRRFSLPRFAIESVFETPKLIGDSEMPSGFKSPYTGTREIFDNACTALRLYKSGKITYNDVYTVPIGWSPMGGKMVSWQNDKFSLIGEKYLLSSEDVSKFKKFWYFFRINNNPQRKSIGIAIRRLNYGLERARTEDNFIDYLIALEALLLTDSERTELGFKLSLRGAKLLGSSKDQRAEIYKELKIAYDLRSRIVHGGTISTTFDIDNHNISFNEFVKKIEEHLRKLIIIFIKNCTRQTEKQFIKQVELKIIKS